VLPEELPPRLLPELPPCAPLELPPRELPEVLPCVLLEPEELPELPDELPPGLVLLPELLLELEFKDKIANSILPEVGLMMVSLMVPRVSPEEPVTLAPISWLARTGCWPIRPVALH